MIIHKNNDFELGYLNGKPINKAYQNGNVVYQRYGRSAARLPEGYTELEYVENRVSVQNVSRTDFFYVQYDDTANSNASAYTYNVILELKVNYSAYWNALGNTYLQIQRADGGYHNKFDPRAFGKTSFTPEIEFKSNIKYDLTIYQGASDIYPTFVLTDVSAGTTSTHSIINDRPMSNTYPRLGIFNFYATSDGGANVALGKIYSVTVTDRNGNVKCEAVPCRREVDGKIGMYNLARNEFTYDASGLMNIVGGPEV